jgi:hypothetical protein
VKLIQMIQVRDGRMFESVDAARQYLDRQYGDLITKIAREVTNRRFTEVTEYIDSNLGLFAELKGIKADMDMDVGNGEED